MSPIRTEKLIGSVLLIAGTGLVFGSTAAGAVIIVIGIINLIN